MFVQTKLHVCTDIPRDPKSIFLSSKSKIQTKHPQKRKQKGKCCAWSSIILDAFVLMQLFQYLQLLVMDQKEVEVSGQILVILQSHFSVWKENNLEENKFREAEFG